VVDRFFADLAEISPVLPLLVRALIVVVVFVIVWIVFSVPAYWLCRTLGTFLKASLSRLVSLRQWLFAKGSEIFSAKTAPIERFLAAHAQMFSFATENKQIGRELARVRAAVEALPTRVASLDASITTAGHSFNAASEALTQVTLPPPVAAPAAQEFHAVRLGANRAAITLVLALLLTPAFVVFNTAMLNEFLGGFWPGLDFFGIQLSLVLAGFATLLEIGLGVFLVAFPNRPAQLAWYSGIVILAFIEMSFYARLGQGFNWSIFDAFYAQGGAPAWTKLWFGALGIVLVLCLAGAGHALFSSISQLGDQHIVKQWRKYISERMRHATTMKQKLSEAERSKNLLTQSLSEVQTHFATAESATSSGLVALETSKQQFLDQVSRAAAIRLEDVRRLDRGAMMRLFIECLVFAVTIGFALSLIAMVYETLVWITPLLWLSGFWLGWVVALGEAVLLFGGGSAFSRANVTLPAAEGIPATNLTQSRAGPILGVAMLIFVVFANAFYVLRGWSMTSVMLFLLVTAADVFLFWCGTRLGMIGAAVWAVVASAGYTAAAFGIWSAALVVGFVGLVWGGLRFFLVMVAYPYSILVLRDPSGAQLL